MPLMRHSTYPWFAFGVGTDNHDEPTFKALPTHDVNFFSRLIYVSQVTHFLKYIHLSNRGL